MSLTLENLKKTYPDFELDLSLTVEDGEFLSIIGPSGSGKSTALSLISGLEPPDSGRIVLDGNDITKTPAQKRSIGMVFQDYALFPSMNVEKNISYAMKVRKIRGRERKSRTAALLDFVNLPGYNKRKTTTLSGGEAQRVALARALSAEPRILLLDEPLSALDAGLRRRLKDEIRRIADENPGLSTIYVTHDREEAFSISDRVAVMNSGSLEMVGTPEEVYRRPATLFTAYFTGEGTALPASLFDMPNDADTVFFRPESVTVKDIFYGDATSYITLRDCEVVSAEYLGARYLLGLVHDGQMVLAESAAKPQKRIVDAHIRKNQLLFFKDGRLMA